MIIKPNFYMNEVWQYVQDVMDKNGFTLHYQWHGRLKKHQVWDLYAGLRREKKRYSRIPSQFMLSGKVIVAVFYHPENAIIFAKGLVGPTYAAVAMQGDTMRGRLLRRYGQAQPPYDNAANFIHVPSTEEEHREQLTAILGRNQNRSWYN